MNIETKISNRLKSIFSAFGQIINDFYTEAGIFFIGGFNASLVAWDIYTSLSLDGQPELYCVTIAIIAFIAVEGLAIFLISSAAITGNKVLWFFSIIFAAFFTLAHYQQMIHDESVIAEYVNLAIPFFVVIGYYARTMKSKTENSDIEIIQKQKDADTRNKMIEDEDRQFNRQKMLLEIDKNHELKLAKIEAKKDKNNGQYGDNLTEKQTILANANEAKKDKIAHRRNQVLSIMNDENITQSELAKRLGVSLGTIKGDLKALNGSVIK